MSEVDRFADRRIALLTMTALPLARFDRNRPVYDLLQVSNAYSKEAASIIASDKYGEVLDDSEQIRAVISRSRRMR